MTPPWRDRVKTGFRKALGIKEKILCDSCRWNWRSACHRPERPRAIRCPDYEKRGK